LILKKIIFVLWIPFFIRTAPSLGQGFTTLQIGGNARASALGMAYTALADDGSGAFWNPAGLMFLDKTECLFSLHRWIQGVQSGFLGFGWKGKHAGIGMYLLYTEVGGMEYRLVASPTPISLFSSSEIVGGLSYARTLGRRWSFGLTVKLYYEKIFLDEAVGVGGDIGFLWEMREEGLRIGGVLQNMGGTGRLRNEKIPLPFTGKVGFAFPFCFLGEHWMLAVDGMKEIDLPFHVHGGVEYGWLDRLFLRCGYQTGYATRTLTGGIGLHMGWVRLDYSYMPFRKGLGDAHQLSLRFRM